jgi:hypothetical protein
LKTKKITDWSSVEVPMFWFGEISFYNLLSVANLLPYIDFIDKFGGIRHCLISTKLVLAIGLN